MYKDGQQVPTANLPMGGFKFTGLAAGSATGNSLRYEQLFSTAGVNLLGPINGVKTTVVSATTPDIWTSVGNVVDYTGTATMTGFAAAPQAGSIRFLVCAAASVFTAGANVLFQGVPSAATYTATAGDIIEVFAITTTQFRLTLFPVTGIPGKQPTRTVLTSGSSATYTTPIGATRINVRAVGGGGGGGAVTTNAGAAGGGTTFSTLTAGGGGGGGVQGGGAIAVATASAGGDVTIQPSLGAGGSFATSIVSFAGASGGSGMFGGGGMGLINTNGGTGIANTGGGGAGGGGTAGTGNGGGGGNGGYVEKLITSPSATYTYTIASGGTGGTAGGTAGGNGGTGIIIVDEYYV